MGAQLRGDEIAIKRDLFNGLVDELTDALGWLLVIREENPNVLQKACGHLDADERLAQMSAILGGRTFDRRHAIKATVPRDEPAQWVAEKLSPSGAEDATAHRHNSGNPQLRKRTVEEKEGEDSHNTRG